MLTLFFSFCSALFSLFNTGNYVKRASLTPATSSFSVFYICYFDFYLNWVLTGQSVALQPQQIIAITGATGFIGTKLVQRLVAGIG
jgi:hypothetical protein